MKSIIKLSSPSDIRDFSCGLLVTPELKSSYDNGGLVRGIIDRFCRLPRFFFLPTDLDLEAPHFSPWWGGIMLREYSNKAVQDLYYLHEMEHAGTMPYGPDVNHVLEDPITFKNKIRDNEHQASVFSEMVVYCEIPSLRPQTFEHEIFVDRFLFPAGAHGAPKREFLERWCTEPDILAKEMMYARAAVLTSRQSCETDLSAFWLKRFYEQGKSWTTIWTKGARDKTALGRFALVERRMVLFREECQALGREAALNRHLEWLESPEITENTTIPFFPEAREFAAAYGFNKQRYLDAVQTQRAGTVPLPLRSYSERWG
jgi:hypothetical protein